MRRIFVLAPAVLALLGASVLSAGCGGDDDGEDDLSDPADAETAVATADAELIAATLPPNEIVEADHYYGDAVCQAFVAYDRARRTSEGDRGSPEAAADQRAAALATLVGDLRAIQPPNAYADVHETLIGLAEEASSGSLDSFSRLIGLRVAEDDRQERLQAVANDERSCQQFQERFGLPAFYGATP